ncbi:MAG: hypothetical protein ACRDKB_00045 [Actinomycetota bacterium]
MTTAIFSELIDAGLLDGPDLPHLIEKGRDWLRILEDAETQEVADQSAADLVLSTNGLFR